VRPARRGKGAGKRRATRTVALPLAGRTYWMVS